MQYLKKSLGQNFLIDKNIIKKIIGLVNIKNKNIVEIGPGKGALTDEILKQKPKSINIIEKDKILVDYLKRKYSKFKYLHVHHNDILKFDIEDLNLKNTIIFGNLPYNISSQIIVKIIKFKKWPPEFLDVVFMFQKELGDKIIANFPSLDYGRLSILTNYRLNIIKKFIVSPNCFFPKPKVNSMVIHFRPKNNKLIKIKKINNLEKITNIFFSNKRKMINKNIKKVLSQNQMSKIESLDTNLRPSEIKPDIYYKITELIEKN
jgi:16S rRNA (adenine1518-N6/adenine1519-N6)-dimethyltransferase